MTIEPTFLSVTEVLEIHKNQIESYGGQSGVRDVSLLMSALSLPESTFGGEYLHKDIFKMAATYLYHICQNHPFIDGNKRTALAAALVFLDINGVEINDPEGILYELVIDVALGNKKKGAIAEILRTLNA